MDGLKRLLDQRCFTQSDIVDAQVENYKKDSDSVQLFLEDFGYQSDNQGEVAFKEVYNEYKIFAADAGFSKCSSKTFGARVRAKGIVQVKGRSGQILLIKKCNF